MKFSVLRVPLAVLTLAAGLPVTAHAQRTLDETVVTATRVASRASAVLGDVTVITRDDIERGTGRTLAEVVARQAGVQTSSNGGQGKSSSLFIRGTESRHVLLLVDGVRYTSATAGTPPLDNIPLEQIERIEVLKGPASALYGSDAVGGVIQVFTRRGAPGFSPSASVTLGSEGRREAAAGLRGGSGDVTYSLGLQTLREKGFSATNAAVGTSFNRDRDGFDQDSLSGSVDWRFAPGWKADARLLHSDAVNQYDSGAAPFDVRADVASSIYSVGVEGDITGGWKSRLSFGAGVDKSLNLASATAAPTRFDTRQEQTTWMNDIATGIGRVTAGLERVQQQVSGTTAYTVAQRTTDSLFAGLQGGAGAHSWQANARRDDDSQFGNADTGLLSYGFKFAPQLRAHASYGSSFKAPSFNQLYFPGFGNPSTQPERGRNREVGIAWNAGLHDVSLVRFDNRIRGFITATTTVANIPRARIEGWTLAYAGSGGNFAWRSALDLLDARNDVTGQKLARRADEQLTASLDYSAGSWMLGSTLLAASERFDNAANTVRLSGFTTVDLHADYAVSRDWTAQARLQNLADKTYFTANGYNQPGRAVYVTLRYAPK